MAQDAALAEWLEGDAGRAAVAAAAAELATGATADALRALRTAAQPDTLSAVLRGNPELAEMLRAALRAAE